jgi:hypothetical protein
VLCPKHKVEMRPIRNDRGRMIETCYLGANVRRSKRAIRPLSRSWRKWSRSPSEAPTSQSSSLKECAAKRKKEKEMKPHHTAALALIGWFLMSVSGMRPVASMRRRWPVTFSGWRRGSIRCAPR